MNADLDSDKEKKEFEDRLRHRLEIFRMEFNAGRIKIASHLADGFKRSLSTVRYGKDGEIDLNTVDSRIRAAALGIQVIHDRNEAKKSISLKEIQTGYIEKLYWAFGDLYEGMLEAKATPHQYALFLSIETDFKKDYFNHCMDMSEWAVQLWENAKEVTRYHMDDLKSLKAVFGGEPFPRGEINVASMCGLYLDTIILPDPFVRLNELLKSQNDSQKIYSVIDSALNTLRYRDLINADVDCPIVVFVPDQFTFDERERKLIQEVSELDSIKLVNKTFDLELSSNEEIYNLLEEFDSIGKLADKIIDTSLFKFDVDLNAPFVEHLRTYMEYMADYKISHPGIAFHKYLVSRMMQANDLRRRSVHLKGTPLIDAPTSWFYYQLKLKLDAERLDPNGEPNLHLVRCFQDAISKEISWLGNVPPEVLIEVRKQGALDEIRNIFTKGLLELEELKMDNFGGTSDLIIRNINQAFDNHRKQLENLRGAKWRFAGVELGLCIVKGVISVLSAFGVPLVSLIDTAIDQVVDVPKIKEIPGRWRTLQEESNRLEKSATGLLFSRSKANY